MNGCIRRQGGSQFGWQKVTAQVPNYQHDVISLPEFMCQRSEQWAIFVLVDDAQLKLRNDWQAPVLNEVGDLIHADGINGSDAWLLFQLYPCSLSIYWAVRKLVYSQILPH